ncbi:hypothetical protein [Nannocystis sp. SCPEA4]|uniref:hypothetical protein n=1 Tax=Nannocystis sp. SCPEA4 TaxID=2996787 RepID=UPI00226F2C92|nr:hypothetical protein [Nannocystis sp. SCPEA4]MCY1057613.1 hypothetical protein [Nannocystis sp. SCPEA4]
MPVAAAVLFAALARAADPADTVVVTWQVPQGCPDVEVLHAGIRRSLGGLAVERREPVRVGVLVVREAAQRFRLELRLDAGDGPAERVLTTDSCVAAVDTAAWLIAIAIDVRAVDPAALPPEAPLAGDESESTVPEPPAADPVPRQSPRPDPAAPLRPSPPPPETAAPPPPTTRTEPPPARDRPPPPDRLHLDLWAGGGLGLGLLPRLTPTAALGLTLAGPRWEAELSGHYWALQRDRYSGGHGGKFVHGHVAARGCGAWERGRVRLPLCGGLAAGGITGEGTGALTPQVARSLWLGLLAGVGLRVALHPRVGLLARAEAVLSLRRPGFLLDPRPDVVFRPERFGFSAFLALTIRLR